MNMPENWNWLPDIMKAAESWATEAVKPAMPFARAQEVAKSCARDAVLELEKFNQNYAREKSWFDDGSQFTFEPMDNAEIERAASMLGEYFLVLMHRRGLVGF